MIDTLLENDIMKNIPKKIALKPTSYSSDEPRKPLQANTNRCKSRPQLPPPRVNAIMRSDNPSLAKEALFNVHEFGLGDG